MKASILQENLNKIAAGAARAAASRPPLPVLANVLLKAEKGKLTAIGTDMTVGVGLFSGGQVEAEGAITVTAKDFAALIGGLGPGKVEMETEKGILKIVSGGIKAKMVGISAEEFPDISLTGEQELTMATNKLREGIEKTLFAASGDEGRPILTGIKIGNAKTQNSAGAERKNTKAENELELIATDGYRLSLVKVSSLKGKLEDSVVVPGKALLEVSRMLSGSEKEVKLRLTDDEGMVFIFDEGWVSARLLAGDFPAAEKILPEKFDLEIGIDRAELERAVRTAAIFARETANIIKFEIKNEKPASSAGKLKITANSPQIGENETVLDITRSGPPGGEASEIAFNSRYLLDYLGSAKSAERIKFRMTGPLKPGMFLAEGDEGYWHVIMPVRVQK